MKIIIAALATALAGTACAEEEIFPVVAHSQFTNGITLRTYCDSNREAARAYISGWHDKRYVDMTFIDFPASKLPDEYLVQNAYGAIAGRFCLPKDITLEQLTDAVCAHVAANPKKEHYAGVGQVEGALSAAYPCGEE